MCRVLVALKRLTIRISDPPAKYDPKLQLYITACNATAPIVAFNIGGTSFQMDKRDMLLSGARIGDTCATTFTRGFAGSGFDEDIFPVGFYVLGDAFLYNVVAIFDKGKEQMHFAPHVGY